MEMPKLKVEDVIETESNRRTSSIAGAITSIGRVNVVIHLEIRFAPDGPWFPQDHKIDKTTVVVVVARDGAIIWKK